MCCKLDECVPLIHTWEAELAQIEAAGPATLDALFRITNPSKKLALTAHIYARPGRNGGGVGPEAHDYTDETWQLYAVVEDNPEVQLNAAFYDNSFPPVATPRPLPDSQDIEDGVKIIRGVAHLVANAANQVGEIYKVKCIWEPLDPCMGPDERRYWFARCRVDADGGLESLGNGE